MEKKIILFDSIASARLLTPFFRLADLYLTHPYPNKSAELSEKATERDKFYSDVVLSDGPKISTRNSHGLSMIIPIPVDEISSLLH